MESLAAEVLEDFSNDTWNHSDSTSWADTDYVALVSTFNTVCIFVYFEKNKWMSPQAY
jgi:hypothetical protein